MFLVGSGQTSVNVNSYFEYGLLEYHCLTCLIQWLSIGLIGRLSADEDPMRAVLMPEAHLPR